MDGKAPPINIRHMSSISKIAWAEKEVKKLYQGFTLAFVFTYIRFFDAPLIEIEELIPKTGKIVDLGCGYGIFSNFLALTGPKREIIGVDLNKKKLNQAPRGVAKVQFYHLDITKKKLPKSDAIALIHVLHHLGFKKRQEEVIKKCRLQLKKRGTLVISEVASFPFWKVIITRLVDFLLYPKDKVVYLKEAEMERILKKYFSKVKTYWLPKYWPFPQVVYSAHR